jgi:hypothetical protein
MLSYLALIRQLDVTPEYSQGVREEFARRRKNARLRLSSVTDLGTARATYTTPLDRLNKSLERQRKTVIADTGAFAPNANGTTSALTLRDCCLSLACDPGLQFPVNITRWYLELYLKGIV